MFSLPLQQSVFVVALGVGPRKKKWFADRGHHWQLGSVAVGIGGNVGSRDLVGVERIGYGKGEEEWSGGGGVVGYTKRAVFAGVVLGCFSYIHFLIF